MDLRFENELRSVDPHSSDHSHSADHSYSPDRPGSSNHPRPLEQLGDEIAELSVHLDAATARLLDLIREFDIRGGWGQGFRSCAQWLTWRVGLDPGAARERVRVARALETLPLLRQALARGDLSYAKVRALTRVATPETEERLLKVGRAGTAEHVERIVRGWRKVDRRAEAREAARQDRSRALSVYPDDDGMVILRGRLTPEVGALLQQALAAAREALYQRARRNGMTDDPPTMDPSSLAQQQADALALLAETALHHGSTPERRGSVTRWWSTSRPGCWPIRSSPASRCSRRARAFPRKRPSAWRATPAGWLCGTTPTGGSRRSGPGPGRSRRRCAGRCSTETAAAASRAAGCASARGITSGTGPTEGPRRCRISPCCAGVITVRSTRRAINWIDSRTESCGSVGRTAACWPTCRRRPGCPSIPWRAAGAERGGGAAAARADGDAEVAGRAAGRRLRDRRLASPGAG